MNLIHRMYCCSGRWRAQLSQLLPWAAAGIPLRGATVLELGSGPGLTTDWLRPRVGALATVEYDDPTRRLYVDAFPTSTSITVTRRHCPSVTPPLMGWCVSRCCTMYRPVSCRIGCFSSPGGCCALAECSLAETASGALCLRSLTLATHCYWSIPLACRSGLGQRGFVEATTDLRRSAFRFRAVASDL